MYETYLKSLSRVLPSCSKPVFKIILVINGFKYTWAGLIWMVCKSFQNVNLYFIHVDNIIGMSHLIEGWKHYLPYPFLYYF